MPTCLDVDYRNGEAVAAGLAFRAWQDAVPSASHTRRIAPIEPYQPGQLYRRELPCLLAILELLPEPPDLVLIDGFVWLGDEATPGLGGHLFRALGQKIPVVGVAKNPYLPANPMREVFRGGSKRPLFVSAAGIGLDEAAERVHQMHGNHRIPTLLKAVDSLCRQSCLPSL